MLCSLCSSEIVLFSELQKRTFLRCTECKAILLHPNHFLSPNEEKQRYHLHQNDVNDNGYQKFVSPITNAISEAHPTNHIGLDFGSGSEPIVATLLRRKGYKIFTYDPFFDPDKGALLKKYDFVSCCEVIEHFYTPAKEFELLYDLLVPQGILYCKTNLFDYTMDFKSWWYKNDTTHVFFYTTDTLNWIKEKFRFSSLVISKDLIVFRK